jgi:hypothetical protein
MSDVTMKTAHLVVPELVSFTFWDRITLQYSRLRWIDWLRLALFGFGRLAGACRGPRGRNNARLPESVVQIRDITDGLKSSSRRRQRIQLFSFSRV